MSIELRHLGIGYGRRTLLDDVSTTFAQGSLTALLGRNGSGKSTLLRALAGLGPVASGEVLLCGRPLVQLSPLERASTVSFVTTDKVRIANLACEDVVALGRAPYTNWFGRMQRGDRLILATWGNAVVDAALASLWHETRLPAGVAKQEPGPPVKGEPGKPEHSATCADPAGHAGPAARTSRGRRWRPGSRRRGNPRG